MFLNEKDSLIASRLLSLMPQKSNSLALSFKIKIDCKDKAFKFVKKEELRENQM